MLSRLRGALPLAAGPLVVLAHLAAEALVSGRSLLSLAAEPLHVYLFLLGAISAPLWIFAARRGCLRLCLLTVVASTLALEGNGLGNLALIGAILIASALAWLGGLAIERASLGSPAFTTRVLRYARPVVMRRRSPAFGPYFGFVPIRGNRPPPQLL